MSSIGFFNQYKIWGGGEKWHYTAALFIADKGEQAIVFTHRDGELWKKLQDHQTITLEHISINKYSYFNPISLLRFFWLFKKHKLKSIVFNSQTDVRSAALPAKWAKVKKIFFRAGSPQVLPNKKSYKRALTALSGLVSISEEIRNNFRDKSGEVIQGVSLDIVIPNAIDFREYEKNDAKPIYRAQGSEVILGHAGRFSAEKGQHYLLEVARKLSEKKISFKLLLAGRGETEEELKIRTNELGLSDKIEFVGFLANVKDLISSIDVCVFPSVFEGTSSFLIETMAMRKPIISFDVSSMPEMIEDGITGFRVPFEDLDAFTDRIKRLVKDSDLRKKFGEAAYKKAFRQFNSDINFQKWFELLADPR